MNYLLVDDERIILEGMKMTLQDVVGLDATIFTSQNPYEAIEIAQKNSIDIAFLDVDMPGMNGLKLAAELQNISADTNIVFATGYAHYSLDAWKTTAKDFILKPVSEDELRNVIDKIEKLIAKNKASDDSRSDRSEDGERGRDRSRRGDAGEGDGERVKVMCFGNFEVSYAGRPIHFARKKSKEMFAYLIDRRGAMISTDEIRTILWEEDVDTEEKKGYVRVLANDIKKSFEHVGIQNILINGQDCYCVDSSLVSCDYFDFMDNKQEAIKSFQNEYMVQYSWGELTLGRLLNMRD